MHKEDELNNLFNHFFGEEKKEQKKETPKTTKGFTSFITPEMTEKLIKIDELVREFDEDFSKALLNSCSNPPEYSEETVYQNIQLAMFTEQFKELKRTSILCSTIHEVDKANIDDVVKATGSNVEELASKYMLYLLFKH